MPTLHQNKDVFFKFDLKERYEAGMELAGWEVQSIKHGNIQLQGSYVRILGDELYLVNAHVSVPQVVAGDLDPTRSRRLLLKRSEITQIQLEMQKKGLTLVPVRLFVTRGLIKLEIALAKGKKRFEQALAKKRKTQEKSLRREMKDLGY